MAENDSTDQTNVDELLVEIKIFTQLPQVHGDSQMLHVRAATSVGELKQQILETFPSRPAVTRQRLIFRGRVLARDTDTLIDVFGREPVQRQERQTLHLVIRDMYTTTTSSNSSTNSNTALPRPTPGRSVPAQSNPGLLPANQQEPSDSRPFPSSRLPSLQNSNLNASQTTHTQHPLHQPAQSQPRSISPAVLPQSPFQPPFQPRGSTPAGGGLYQQLQHQQALHQAQQQAQQQPHQQAQQQVLHQAQQQAQQQLHQLAQQQPQHQTQYHAQHQAQHQAHAQAHAQAHQRALQSLLNLPLGQPHTSGNSTFGNPHQNNPQLPNNVNSQASTLNQTALDQANSTLNDPIAPATQAGHQPTSAEASSPSAAATASSALTFNQRQSSGASGTGQETSLRELIGDDLDSDTPPLRASFAPYELPMQASWHYGPNAGGIRALSPGHSDPPSHPDRLSTLYRPGRFDRSSRPGRHGRPDRSDGPSRPTRSGRPIRNRSPTHFPPTTSAGLGMAPFSQGPSRWHPHYRRWEGPTHAVDYMRTLQERIEMALQVCRWCYPPVDDPVRSTVVTYGLVFLRDLVALRNTGQAEINSVLRDGAPTGSSAPTPQQVAELQTLNFRFRSVVRDWMADIEEVRQMRDAGGTSANGGTASRTNQSSAPASSSMQPSQTVTPPIADTSAIAYILHSTSGPVAILYDGQGAYSSVSSAGTTTLPAANNVQDTRNLPNTEQQARNPVEGPALMHGALPNIANQGNNANQDPVRQGLQLLGNRAQAEPNVIAINVTPFLQAIWLFVRVYVFIWVFLGGRGLGDRFLSWQTFGLFAMIAAYGALRVGIGAERFEVLRRYWNDLVGIEPAQDQRPNQARPEQARNEAAQPQAANQTGASDSSRSIDQNQQQAQDQLENRAGNDGAGRGQGSLRELFRPLERTVALFLGSLYPGVGERHIAERERMRREAEERDRARAATAAQEEQRRSSSTSLPPPSSLPNNDAASDHQQQGSAEVISSVAETLDLSHGQSSTAKAETPGQAEDSQGSSSAIETTPENGNISQRKTNDDNPNTDET